MKALTAVLLALLSSMALAASPSGTVVNAGSTSTITDSAGAVWGINATAPCTATWAAKGTVSEVTKGGTVDPNSCQVSEIAYVASVVWQENTSGQWYPWAGTAWGTMQTTSPLPPTQAVLTWTAPTTNTDGSPISQPLTYNIYRGTSATSLTKLTSVTGLTYTDPAGSSTATTYFYAVTVVEAGSESAESNVVSEAIAAAALTPSAPALAVH